MTHKNKNSSSIRTCDAGPKATARKIASVEPSNSTVANNSEKLVLFRDIGNQTSRWLRPSALPPGAVRVLFKDGKTAWTILSKPLPNERQHVLSGFKPELQKKIRLIAKSFEQFYPFGYQDWTIFFGKVKDAEFKINQLSRVAACLNSYKKKCSSIPKVIIDAARVVIARHIIPFGSSARLRKLRQNLVEDFSFWVQK